MSSQQRIAIVGGGPAGLTLALLLHKHGIPATIFELRQKPTEEEFAKPSGMLDLHEGSGIDAIKECGLFDDFIPLTGDCAEATIVADKHGSILYERNSERLSRPEISRNALNKLLIGNLPPGAIKWGHKLLSATCTTTGGHTETELDFGPHGKQTFDLVVGADGAWSRVRKLIAGEKPYYAGRQIITLTITHITEKYPHLAELVGPGSFMALGGRNGVVSQRGPVDSARIYIFLSLAPEGSSSSTTSSGLAGQTPGAARDKLLESDALLGTWGAPIKELVAAGCEEEAARDPAAKLDIRAMYTQSVGSSWDHRPGVTLIGDAAHLMLPSGEGVNLGMLDALLLSRAIVEASLEATAGDGDVATSFRDTFDPLLKAFEVDLGARAKTAAEHSQWLSKVMFEEDGATALAMAFQGWVN
ncbi:hypothetical protein VPNG_01982 [Cytospora leucostoma]|uniref:FAD-binding domain-containing protein n=1 Tax=Cytospora leucostoma TaxID=1230097 RepID=A0A423XID3_9PEZI|nr:hypothetical protein VPNG_01982 [Cytospora leucostoma]